MAETDPPRPAGPVGPSSAEPDLPAAPVGAAPAAPDLPAACAEIREHLYARAEGESLPGSAARMLDEHLSVCEACAAEFRRAGEFTTRISRLLGELRPGPEMRKKVLDSIEPVVRSRRGAGSLRAGVAALVAALAAGLVLLALAGEEPAARVEDASGPVRVLTFSGGEWRLRAGPDIPSEVGFGDRVELGAGGLAALAIRGSRLRFEGPALVQLQRGPDVLPVVHVLRRARATVEAAGPETLVIEAGDVRLEAKDARFVLDVDSTGECDLGVISGEVRAHDADGNRAVGPAGRSRLRQRRER
ncbi:MAG: zf-HC2 domain-containing protein [Planctomycetota bacterium]